MGGGGAKVGSLCGWLNDDLECRWSTNIWEDEGPLKMHKYIKQNQPRNL